jgi:hypothetical protein
MLGIKGKVVPVLTNYALHHEDIWANGSTDPHFLDLGTS